MSVNKNTRGSIMIAALIVALITGSLVGLFLTTITDEVKYSHQARMAFQAVNLAEAGLEHAMFAMINDDWTNWSAGSNGYYRQTFPYISYSFNGETRNVKVYVEPDRNPAPAAIAEATVTLPNGVTVTRQIYVEMSRGTSDDPTKGGFWGNGILGKNGLTFGGNKQTVDSFVSSTNPNGYLNITDIYNAQTATTILGHTLANGNGSIASLSVEITDISLGNADVYGPMATGAALAGSDLKKVFGPNGSLYTGDSELLDLNNGIDHNHIAYDFEADLPDPVAPEMVGPITSLSGSTIGAAGSETEYLIPSMDLGSKDSYTVQGKVTMIIDGAMTVKGEINLAEGASLELYVKGDIDIGGNGLVNSYQPANLVIFNTGKGTSIKLHGNGFLSAAVYAPNSDVSLRGGGTSGAMFGAVVGDTVTFSGNNYDFHYDEDLANFGDDDADPDDGSFIPEVSNWVELTAASEKKNMATILTDGL